MINRENWQDIRAYLDHMRQMDRDVESVRRVWCYLRHLLEWADDRRLGSARLFDPSFQVYLLTARADGRQKRLSAASMKKSCEYARRFFKWARGAHPARYKQISEDWADTIRPSLARGTHSEYHEHKFYTLEQLRKIAALKPKNLKEERDQAAVCFLFLSAMRGQAFVSMPIGAVDVERGVVDQFPEIGVRTKNRKAARTHLLMIPELMDVVRAWHEKLRAAGLGDDDIWFQALDSWHVNFSRRRDLNWLARRAVVADGLQDLCELAGVPYLSPHKLRHGHAVYMMRKIKDMRQLKSLSQNLMHESVDTTDKIYGRMVRNDIEDVYREFGSGE